MNDLVQFLMSREIMVVYLISGIAFFICLIVYFFEKNNERIRRRHNTKELNKLVEQVREKVPVEEVVSYDEPVLETIEVLDDVPSVSEMLEQTTPTEVEISESDVLLHNDETLGEESIEELENVSVEDELQYTSIEPDQETARLEIERLTKELEEQEKNDSVIELTNYEEEQEATAIISMDELLKRGRELYESNEVTQYMDDGNEPISIQDLERQIAKETKEEVIQEEMPVIQEVISSVETSSVVNVAKEEETHKFKSSPIISPIYGIEKNPSENELSLENTANYEKLDEQIKKSNEFVMSLKEFQKNLD